MSLRYLSSLAILLFVSALAVACGEPVSNMSHVDDGSPRVNHNNGGGGGGGGGGTGDYILEATDGTEFESNLDGSITLVVRMTDGNGNAASSQTVRYEVIDEPGGSDVSLDVINVITDDDGRASNRVRVGESPGNVTVRASSEQASNTVDFNVDVTTVPAGGMNVSVEYTEEDLMELTGVDIRFWEMSRVECNFVAPYALPSDPFIDEVFMETVADEVSFENLQTTDRYTVTATGYGNHGQISAHGCADDIVIEGDSVTDVVVPIALQDLRPLGAYDVMSTWDFTEALAASGPVGSAITDTFEWITNPGQAAASFMVGELVDWVCDEYGTLSWECGAAQAAQWEGSAESTIANFINDQVSSIGILNDFQNMAQDLMNVVSELTIESVLTIETKAAGEGEVSGVDVWRAIYVYWTRDCDANSPPDCGEIRLGLGDDTEFGGLEGKWDGRVKDYDQLEIDPHEMIIPYGQFITHVMRQYLIPALTDGNADSLSGAFEYLLCDNIGGIDMWGVSFSEDQVQGFCSMAFNSVGLLAELYINNLHYDVGLDIMGEGRLIDLVSDGRVDMIEDGHFYGEVEGENGQTTDMESFFTAERRN